MNNESLFRCGILQDTGSCSAQERRPFKDRVSRDGRSSQFIPKLIELYQKGQFPFDQLEKFYAFSDINKAIADSRRGDTIKPVLLISKA